MNRLLVVSRNAGIWQALMQAADLDVAGTRPDKLDAWLATDSRVDCAVIDVFNGADALDIVERLRGRQESVPCVLVSSNDPSWAVVQRQTLPGVRVLPLPLSRSDVLGLVNAMTVGSDPSQLRVEEAGDEAPEEPEPAEPAGPARDKPIASDASGPQRLAAATAHPRVPTRDPASEPRMVGSPLLSATPATSGNGSSAASAAAPRVHTRGNVDLGESLPGVHSPTRGLLRQVLASAEGLPHPGAVAARIVSSVETVVTADALAVLCRDDGGWAVMAGHDLRTIEWAGRVSDGHWLVSQVQHAQHGLVIEDTDIARSRLAGAPLSHWKHLLAVPLAPFAFVVAGRAGEAFTASDLTGVARAADRETLELLGTALDGRELARALEHLLDDPPSAFATERDQPGAYSAPR